MSKLFIFLCFFFLASACENVVDCQKQENQKLAACLPPENVEPLPEGDNILEAQVLFTNFGPSDEDKVYAAITLIKRVVSSPEFRQRIEDFTYQGRKQFVDTKLSNAAVYQKLIEGMEILEGDIDQEMDLELELYYAANNTVGYTYPNVNKIWMNRKYFDRYTTLEVANNVFHEWTHKLGFEHAVSYSDSRNYSVPYAVGNLIEELAKRLQ